MLKLKTAYERQKDEIFAEGDWKSTKEMFERIARVYPNKNILANLNDKGEIVYHTTNDVLNDIESIGNGMLALGYEGKHIAVSGENSYEYLMTDMAVMGGVGAICPIDKDAPADLFGMLLNKCDAEVICCSSVMVNKVEQVLPNCPMLKEIITLDAKVKDYKTIQEVIELGQAQPENLYRKKELDLDATCEILFTSGTTGANKGVELTQNNLAGEMMNAAQSVRFFPEEYMTSMSVLPMYHSTEINAHLLLKMSIGKLTYLNDGMKTLMKNIKVFKPHVIVVVPMIANMFYKNIWLSAKKNGKEKKLKRAIKLSNFLKKFGIDITQKLFKQIYEPFGGNLKEIICGGAPLNPETVKGLRDFGIYIVNGFGITECGPLVSVNGDTMKDVNSIGYPCPRVTVKIDKPNEQGIGELCVKSKAVAKGYYKDPEATKKAFAEDGYFHTGDYAYISENGKIFLSGRKKNTIVLENGKNVYPEEIEREIENQLDYVKEVVVYAGKIKAKDEDKTVICAGLYIDDENIRSNAAQIKKDFIEINKKLSVYKRVAYIDLFNEEFEKTSSKKIKREPAADKHKEVGGIII